MGLKLTEQIINAKQFKLQFRIRNSKKPIG